MSRVNLLRDIDFNGYVNDSLLDNSGIYLSNDRAGIVADNQRKRALTQVQRFTGSGASNSFGGIGSYGNSINNSMNTIQTAFNNLANALDQLNINYMFDNAGYFAFKTTDNKGNLTFSTNLSRLRKQLRQSGNKVLSTNRVWSPCIAWHKFLNVGTYYAPKYSNMSMDDAYQSSVRSRAKNVQKKIVYYAKNPDKLAIKVNSLADSRAKLLARYDGYANFYGAISTNSAAVLNAIGGNNNNILGGIDGR